MAGSLMEMRGCGLWEPTEYGVGEAAASEWGPEEDLVIGQVW